MDGSPSRNKQPQHLPNSSPSKSPKMSMLAMVTPPAHPPFTHKYSWDMPLSSGQSRSRDDSRTVALPSIRQAFPELGLTIPPRDNVVKPANHSPGVPTSRPITSPEYIHSPEARKRRRISNEDEQETLRVRQVPRLYHSPEQPKNRELSPAHETRLGFFVRSAAIPSPIEMKDKGDYPRPQLPSLPPAMSFERDATTLPRYRERHTEDHHGNRSTAPPGPPSDLPRSRDGHAPFQDVNATYAYQQNSRTQPTSAGATGPYDGASFSAGNAFGGHYQDVGRYGELGSLSRGSDGKQRKRRGNLPKETTDQLRAWFVGHLQHPYPTEDEKQELMRKTGLQMNQISNWFINARRRQLPAMISNARTESDVINSQSCDAKMLSPVERSDFSRGNQDNLPLSDGEGVGYDDEAARRLNSIKRGSV